MRFFGKCVLILTIVLASFATQPKPAYAQCESDISLASIEVIVQALMDALVEMVWSTVSNFITSYLYDIALGPILDIINQLEDAVLGGMGDMAQRLLPLLPEMMKQLSVARLDQTAKIGFFMDAESQIRVQKLLQRHEQRSLLSHLPNDLVCSPASGTLGFISKEATSRAVARALGYELAKQVSSLVTAQAEPDPGLGVIKSAVAAADDRGPVPDINFRWQEHLAKYCEPGESKGAVPCASSGEWTDADMLIGKMVLNRLTIDDIGDPEYQAALKAMARNLFDPIYPDPIPEKTMNSPNGLIAIAQRRSERARRQTAYDMYVGAIARRTPDISMYEWNQTLRLAAGIGDQDISERPSYNELAQTFVQARYMAPDYFIKIGGNKPQFEEIVQKTGLLMQLRDEYELTETLAMMYGAQLGMALDNAGKPDAMSEESMSP